MENNLKQNIMGRVYAIYLTRRYGGVVALTLALFVAVIEFLRFVSVSKVVANMPSITDAKASYNFFSVAIQNTETAVQLSLGLVLVAMTFYAISLIKRLQESKVSRFAHL